MKKRKTGNKAAPSAKTAPGRAQPALTARAHSATPVAKKTAAARPAALKPTARAKATPTKSPINKAAPTRSTPAKAAPAKATPAKVAPAKATPARATPKPSPSATRRSAPPARAAVPSRDDDARRRIQALEQERAELQNLGNQMRAELDSALAETERLREHLREQMRDLESAQRRQVAAEPGPASPGGFDPAADLDEEIPAAPDDDLDETAGFFDRMDEIRARRNELDRERNDRELEQSDQPFWMICPKCGDLMEESEGENVKLERCENCGGLYLDRGEVDLILSLCVGPDAYRRLHNIMKF
jgi:hypothetical protein